MYNLHITCVNITLGLNKDIQWMLGEMLDRLTRASPRLIRSGKIVFSL